MKKTRYKDIEETEIDAYLKKANRKAKLSKPANEFCKLSNNIVNFIFYLMDLSQMCDNAAETYIKITKKRKLKKDEKEQYIKYFRKLYPLLSEMVICKLIDGFLTYMVDLFRIILKEKPELLKSNETLKFDEILNFSTMDDLVNNLIERKILNLSYSGFETLFKWSLDRLGISIVNNDYEKILLIELIETRNTIVHNKSIIGSKYLNNVKDPEFSLGEHREISIYYIARSYGLLVSIVKTLDKELQTKFRLHS